MAKSKKISTKPASQYMKEMLDDQENFSRSAKARARDAKGKYDFSNLSLICTCGHALGVHAAENETKKRACLNEDCGDKKKCSCTNFKKKKNG